MFRIASVRRRVRRARPRLAVEALEVRDVPANNLSITSSGLSSNVTFVQAGSVLTVLTTGGSAQLAIDELESALKTPGVSAVVLSTSVATPGGVDADEDGSIRWD